ncbi:hypothetical protein [Niabella soli]|uniref:Uncharacterized protein n=1 Tax=Niabella soli DSM 19437 TaxID=929713 RepID=W0F773_9BACT|nr:hypothetical protein [Niabella soli]AHF17304.1 hypothetical protein NIASO_05415 [Niabella soli DSM 19437]
MPVTLQNSNLNEQQMLMLRLLTNPLSERDFAQVRRFIVKLLAKQIDSAVDKWEQDNNVTEETYEKLSREHFRSKPF